MLQSNKSILYLIMWKGNQLSHNHLHTIRWTCWLFFLFISAFSLASMLDPFDGTEKCNFCFVESFCIGFLVTAFVLNFCSVFIFHGTNASGSPLICPTWCFSSHGAFEPQLLAKQASTFTVKTELFAWHHSLNGG